MAIEVRIEKDVALLAELDKLTTTAINQVANAISDELQSEIRQQIRETNTVASGRLLRSISSQVLTQFGSNIELQVGSNLPYAQFAETGRGPGGQPPVDAIMEWMVDKGVHSPYGLESGAYLIARKIGSEGTQGKFFFEKGVENVLERLPSIADSIFNNIGKKKGFFARIFGRLFR